MGMKKLCRASILRTGAVSLGLMFIASHSVACKDASIAGVWQGPFFEATLTVELIYSDAGWSGAYIGRSDGRTDRELLRPLSDVAVKDCAVEFGLTEFTPPTSFNLRVGDAGERLQGSVSIEGVPSTFPVTLTRVK